MDIYYNAKSDKRPIIYKEELEYYAQQLKALVTAYRNHIYVRTDEQDDALRELEYYAEQLMSENYDAVIMNSKEIISNADPLFEPPF